MASTTFQNILHNAEAVNIIYPIGSIFMSVADTSPASLFPGTSWVQLENRFLMAAGSTYPAGSTGGTTSVSYTPDGTVGSHILTTEEIPSHAHNLNAHTHGAGTYAGVQSTTHTHQQQGWTRQHNMGSGTPHMRLRWPLSELNQSDDSSTAMLTAGSHSHTLSGATEKATGDTAAYGGGEGHSHTFSGTAATISTMPPYLVVYMWKRTA